MSRNLAQAITNNALYTADIVKSVVLRPLGNGFWLMKRLGCGKAFSARGQADANYAPGMSVDVGANLGGPDKAIITLPPMGRKGASELPYNTVDPGIYDGLIVNRANPNEVPRGVTGFAVNLFGGVFLASPVDSVQAVVFNTTTMDWDADPLVTVGSVVFVSTTEITITLDVSADAPIGYRPKFKVYRT